MRGWLLLHRRVKLDDAERLPRGLLLRARIDGFVDKRAFLPPVSAHVYVPPRSVRTPDDAWRETDTAFDADGGWRSVLRWLDANLGRRGEPTPGTAPALPQTP